MLNKGMFVKMKIFLEVLAVDVYLKFVEPVEY